MKPIIKKLLIVLVASMTMSAVHADIVIDVSSPGESKDATASLRMAILKAASYRGKEHVTISLKPGVYNISKMKATARLQHITNTTSHDENPEAVKHYGLYFKDMSDVTLDGNGSVLMTHGEMTPISVDSCRNISITGLTIDAADPSVAEMRVESRSDSLLVCRLLPRTKCLVRDGKLYFIGEGWEFTGGIAQIYNGTTTLRCESPLDKYRSAELRGDEVTLHYAAGDAPVCRKGEVFQMRHSFRTEVATFINRSRNVTLSDIDYRFLGNFGIVGQFSENITLDNVTCSPEPEGERTCAGFADFVQMSGCSGLVKIKDCSFAGAHDDPINIHGTHLKVAKAEGKDVRVRFMHGQTYGFMPFATGDTLAMVDAESLKPFAEAVVVGAEMIDDYEVRLQLDRDLCNLIAGHEDVVVENLTATPEVEITGCTFTLTPTRGILLTTPRRAVISDNTFVNIPMSAILIADDGKSWYESGAVKDVEIARNKFIDCASPVISIAPENRKDDGPVHSNVRIIDNVFTYSNPAKPPVPVAFRSVESLLMRGNLLINE